MSKSTTIVTTTTALSAIAGTIAADAAKSTPSKQQILNTMARGIAGAKHDWGFLTGAEGPVVQKGIPDVRLAGIDAPKASAAALLAHDGGIPAFTITAEPAPLYTPEMARYLEKQLQGDLLAIAEDFSTDTDNSTGVQCMFEPTAIFATPEGMAIAPRSLWGADPNLIERTARAYFAASSSEVVNSLILDAALSWPDEAATSSFKAFHFPHAVVVTADYLFEALSTMADDVGYEGNEDGDDEDSSQEDDVASIANGAIRVFVDANQDADARAATLAQVESFVHRLYSFMGASDPRWANIAVR